MRLEDASYQVDNTGYAFLEVFVDGKPTRIYAAYEQKFLDRGIVFLGMEWEGLVDEIEIEAQPKKDLGALTLRGFVQDKRLVAMVQRMRELDRLGLLLPGPAEIPRAED